MPRAQQPSFYPNSRFKNETPNEKKSLVGLKYHHIYKSPRGKSHIYEKYTKDKSFSALKIVGPSDSSLGLDSVGNIKILTGIKTKAKGAGSGKLAIKSWGQQQLHNERSDIQYNCGEDPDNIALAVLAYGDTVEENRGSERTIRANKIIIKADSELVLQGGSIYLQGGEDAKGAIFLNGGNLNFNGTNFIADVGGETRFRFNEINFNSIDPRSTFNIATAGSYTAIIGGSCVEYVKCNKSTVIGGRKNRFAIPTDVSNPLNPPAYKLTIIRGKYQLDVKRSIAQVDARFFNVNAKRSANISSRRNTNISATGNIRLSSVRNTSISSNRHVSISSTNRIGISANNNIRIASVGTVMIIRKPTPPKETRDAFKKRVDADIAAGRRPSL